MIYDVVWAAHLISLCEAQNQGLTVYKYKNASGIYKTWERSWYRIVLLKCRLSDNRLVAKSLKTSAQSSTEEWDEKRTWHKILYSDISSSCKRYKTNVKSGCRILKWRLCSEPGPWPWCGLLNPYTHRKSRHVFLSWDTGKTATQLCCLKVVCKSGKGDVYGCSSWDSENIGESCDLVNRDELVLKRGFFQILWTDELLAPYNRMFEGNVLLLICMK